MKSTEIFDVCHARYRGLREWLKDATGAVRSLDMEKPSAGYQWRPDRARACEYVADFERIGRRALRRPEWKGRLKLFNVYFVRGAEYRRAIRLVGVAEGTFDYWYGEVKRALGSEFSRTGLYPPSRYFQSRMESVKESTNQHQIPRRPESGLLRDDGKSLAGGG
ncbi:MAG: hypothetical protein LAN36_15655 [Acidobacteriia bacterium]|nr:hypothetical protein [Terriglobia bacterium]